MAGSKPRFDERTLLILAAFLTVVAWQFSLGRLIFYPFTLFATYVHELGHGIAAIMVGGSFHSLQVFPNGSGLASFSGSHGRIGLSIVAAGGLVGPTIAGAMLLAVSRYKKWVPFCLMAVAIGLVLTVILFARNLFGAAFGLAVAAGLFLAAIKAPAKGKTFVLQLVGVQLSLSVFKDFGYMFSPGASVGGRQLPSDTMQISQALFLPYWFWGGLIATFALGMTVLGLYLGLRRMKKT